MPFYQSCKTAACGIISCCDRWQAGSEFDARYRDTRDPLKRSFIRLASWPKTPTPSIKKFKWIGDHRTPSNSDQSQEDNIHDEVSDSASVDIALKIFTYDIELFGRERDKPVYRRLLLDFTVVINAVSDEIPRLLNRPVTPYNGKEVKLPNGVYVKPVGTLVIKWQLYKGKRAYKTKFLVIEDSLFDMLLGRPTIKKYKLWEEDRDIKKRLR
ncbi:retropepsin-like aspartic protease [Aspergillus undulatus]|uniref:retropepsin-like aspartic protease n=1 Tax=Aspergillus undulatus TaxID=1810928 RepID=UPI003CCE2FED